MWYVKFYVEPQEEPVEVYAEDVDFESSMIHLFIYGIRTKHRSATIHVPENETYKELAEAKCIVIPHNHLCIAYEIDEPREVRRIDEVKGDDESVKV